MKSFFFLITLCFCFLTIVTNGQNLLSHPSIENMNKSNVLVISHTSDIRLYEKGINKKSLQNEKYLKLRTTLYRPEIVNVVDIDTFRYTYTYNSYGDRLTQLVESKTNYGWISKSRHTITYDNFENLITYLEETWWNNAWVNDYRTTRTYDNNGNELTFLYEKWTNNTWVNFLRSTKIYDNNNSSYIVVFESWSNNSWENTDRSTYTVNANDNILQILTEIWVDNGWVNWGKDTATFDSKGNMLTFLYKTWTNNFWLTSYRISYTYDNNSDLLTDLVETLTNNVWVNESRTTHSYDNSRNLLAMLSETWWNNAWVSTVKTTYNYDNNGNAIKGESFQWTENSWLTTRSSLSLHYNYGANEFYIYGSSADVTYTLIVTDINNNVSVTNTYNISQNYPNPFNPSTVIQYALPYESNVSISVYNTLGQVVKTFNEGTKQTGSYNVNFNGEGLSSGMYLYNINAVSIDLKQNFQATKKMILIK